MRLIVQVPCYNEEKTLPLVLSSIPKRIKGIRKIETQIIDDGSTDKTAEVARKFKVNHIIRFNYNKGLAAAFKAGVDNALKQKADILVNTDGDNQYNGLDIKKLVQPILKKKADIVIGVRPIADHPEFSALKIFLQRIGSYIVRLVSQTRVEDVTSGFRAYNREALMTISIFTRFSYCLETLIQAGQHNLKVVTVPIRINFKARESRLHKNILDYLLRSGKTIFIIGLLYRSGQLFTTVSLVTFLTALALVLRYLILITFGHSVPQNFWPTVVLAGVLLVVSIQTFLTGILSMMVSSNIKLSSEILYKLRKQEIIKIKKQVN